jgi:hypothetical protein
MAHAHSMLDTQGYRLLFRICNTYCFFTATVVALKRLSDRLQTHLPVLLLIFYQCIYGCIPV